MSANLTIRAATLSDLAAINDIIERAAMCWLLPGRVKRLALPSYRYHSHDLDHMELVVAECGTLCGVAGWEAADPHDLPPDKTGLLLHGLYVDPPHHHQGIGRQLLKAAADAATRGGYDGLLVKAQAGAEGFFGACGMSQLAVEDAARDYPLRFWLATYK